MTFSQKRRTYVPLKPDWEDWHEAFHAGHVHSWRIVDDCAELFPAACGTNPAGNGKGGYSFVGVGMSDFRAAHNEERKTLPNGIFTCKWFYEKGFEVDG